MRNFLPALFSILIIFYSCVSADKLISQGQYDKAIDKGINKLSKKAHNETAQSVDKAYRLANERDNDQINRLILENNNQNWENILEIYRRLNYRQDKIKRITPFMLNGKEVQYAFIDYSAKIANAKSSAAEFYYNQGLDLFKENNKPAYREAFYNFQKAADYNKAKFPDINKLINRCIDYGTTHILISGYNETRGRMPGQYMINATAVSAKFFSNDWHRVYYKQTDDNQAFDYEINLVLTDILISENGMEESDERFKRRIKSGFEYVLDDKGNVMKDSLGNDIKVTRYADISCTLIETRQFKSAKVEAVAEIIDVRAQKVLTNHPLIAETFFEHISAGAVGDLKALPDEQRKRIKVNKVPYPANRELVMETSGSLNNAFKNFIREQRNLIY